VEVSFRCGDGRTQEIPKRCREHLKFQRFEHVLSQKCPSLRLLLCITCEIASQAKWDAGRQHSRTALEDRADRAPKMVSR